jgi:FkbM family methyltransferase
MSRHVTRLVKSVRKLGLMNGSAVFYYYGYHRLFRNEKWAPRQIRISTLSKPVWLRPGVSDWIAMERIFLDREYDPISTQHDKAMDLLKNNILSLGKKPLIIDCGANIGLSSIWFAERFPGATIAAIEPEPENFKILALNAKNYPNILPIHAAISDKMAHVTLRNANDTPWAWQTEEADTGDVQTVTIPHVIGLDPNYALMAVKVDIEGFEVNLFRNATEWADNLPMIVFEMHDWMAPWSGSGHSFFSVLTKLKRDYLVQGENLFSYSHAALAAYHRAR